MSTSLGEPDGTAPYPRSSFDLVVFDCDGVLVDSEVLAIPLDRLLLRHFGVEMTEAEVADRFLGRSNSAIAEYIEAHLGHPLPADWEKPFDDLYRTAFDRQLRAVDGVELALDAIDLPKCVASSSQPDQLVHKLELTGLADRFDGCIYSAALVQHGKPAPDLFHYAAAQMGIDPARCAVVEDSPYGIQAARAAGMTAFGYAGGLTAASALVGHSTTVFDDMRLLPQLLR
jgi:HAD superfamily hydrolase (TIGR01509 family)